MNKIILENGSEVKIIESTSTFRSKRSELISFYCDCAECGDIYIDVPISEILHIKGNIFICKTSFENNLYKYFSDESYLYSPPKEN